MELQKEQISYNIPLFRKKVSLSAGGDVIVPDTKPDMEELLRTSVNLRISGIDVVKGRLTIRGCADFTVLYRAEGDPTHIKSIGTSFPFSHTEEHADIGADDLVPVSLHMESVSGRMQNSRKLSVGALFSLSLSCEKESSFSAVQEIVGEDSKTEYLKTTLDTCRSALSCTGEFSVEETLEIPGANPPLSEIHSVEVKFVPSDIKIIQNKIVWKGSAHIVTLYSSEDDGEPVATMEHEVPLTEILDVDGIRESMICRITPTVTDISYHTENEKNVALRLEAKADVTALEIAPLSLITDAYAPRKKFTGEMASLTVSCPRGDRSDTFSHRQSVTLEESEPSISRVLDCRATPVLLRADPTDGGIDMEGKLLLSFLYVTDEGTVSPLNREFTFSHRLDIPAATPSMTCHLSITPTHTAYTMMSHDEIECRLLMSIESLLTEEKEIPYLTHAAEEDAPPANRPSIMICFAEANDSLWKIAKRYNISLEDLLAANDMEEETAITKGMQLLIPR